MSENGDEVAELVSDDGRTAWVRIEMVPPRSVPAHLALAFAHPFAIVVGNADEDEQCAIMASIEDRVPIEAIPNWRLVWRGKLA